MICLSARNKKLEINKRIEIVLLTLYFARNQKKLKEIAFLVIQDFTKTQHRHKKRIKNLILYKVNQFWLLKTEKRKKTAKRNPPFLLI